MKKVLILLQICIVFISLSFVLPSDTLRERVLNKIKSFYASIPIEKVYVHTDKPYYVAGENIWFKAYLVDGMNHQFAAPSKNLYVDLVDATGKVEKAITLQNTGEGGIAGDFELDEEIEAGIYLLRAYTRSMQNFPDPFIFQKEIRVYDKQTAADKTASQDTVSQDKAPFEIQFFPEGGDLVNGILSKVGFKAVGVNGKGIEVEGRIIDESGTFITTFKSFKFGLGVFNLTAFVGKKYTAEVTHQGIKQEVVLPEVKPEGYTIQYLPGTEEKFYVVLQSSQPEGLKGALLYGHSRGNSFLAESVTNPVNKATVEVSTSSISEGVVHLTLFSPQGIPVCERLIFTSKSNQNTQLSVHPDRPTYNNRSKVKLKLQLKPTKDSTNVEQADLSISITDQSLVAHPNYALDIRSYLLLTSELQGRIEYPAYYFDPSNQGADFLLDLLMMTQGWRRFSWDQLFASEVPTVQFLPEQSLSISGQITKIGEADKPLRAQVFFNTLDDNFLTGEVITEENGRFAFEGLTFVDTTTVILRANKYTKQNKKGDKASTGNRNVEIRLDQALPPQFSKEWAIPFYDQSVETLHKYVETQQNIAMIDSTYRHRTINLDTISIEARKVNKQEELRSPTQLYRRPDHRLVLDSIGPAAYAYPSLFELIQSRFPGVQVQGEFPNQEVIMRGTTSLSGSNAALFVVDGVMISSDGVNSIPVGDVAYIDILKNTSAAIYGGRAANGIIAVYTKKGENRELSPSSRPRLGVLDFQHPGYYQARQFYQPNYDRKLPQHTKPDIRTTLYWNPKVQIDKKGTLNLEFYTDDKKSTYQVDVQGLSRDGTPLSAQTVFEVE